MMNNNNNNTVKIKIINDDLKQYYTITFTNSKNYSTDSGFDIYCPQNLIIPPHAIGYKIDLGIKTKFIDSQKNNVGYMMLPRSSMGSKTPLRLSNSIGIIDASYRGNLIACVDNVSSQTYTINKGDRLLQIVSFNGLPIYHDVVEDIDTTPRGENGFGSSGR